MLLAGTLVSPCTVGLHQVNCICCIIVLFTLLSKLPEATVVGTILIKLKKSVQYFVFEVLIKYTDVFLRYLVFFEELFKVVGAGGEDAAVSTELDVFDDHGNVAVLALQPLLVQQLQEDALMFVVHVLHHFRHLRTGTDHVIRFKAPWSGGNDTYS